jgi:integrase
MPKRILPLTDKEISTAKAKKKAITLFDGGGLFLLITPTGGKLWRFKYRFEGKGKSLAFGIYPDVSLLDARRKRDEARRNIANGANPAAVKKAEKLAKMVEVDTFELVAREWFKKFSPKWVELHREITERRLEVDLFPWLGSRPIAEIKAPELLAVLRRVESRGAINAAHKLRVIAGQVFRYAVATGKAERDPSGDLRGALPSAEVVHYPAITSPKEVAPLLRALDGYTGSFVVRCALMLSPLLFVRPGELRNAEWSEFDFDEAVWNIPAARMKMRQALVVPLSIQAVAIFKELLALTGTGKYCFPGVKAGNTTLSKFTIPQAIHAIGYGKDVMTVHGFRAMARTILDEVLNVRPDFIECQLGHAVRDANGRAYNRTSHLPERRVMMQTWADYLDKLKAGAEVIPFKTAKG